MDWVQEQGWLAKAPRYVTVELVDEGQIYSLEESGSIWLRKKGLLVDALKEEKLQQGGAFPYYKQALELL